MIILGKKFINRMYGAAAGTRLYVMTGPVPTVDEAFVFTATNYTAQTIATYTVTKIASNNTMTLTTTPAPINALVDGTATWFALSNTSTPAIIGSVGVAGSGNPLTLPTLTAVKGTAFAIGQLSIQFTS